MTAYSLPRHAKRCGNPGSPRAIVVTSNVPGTGAIGSLIDAAAGAATATLRREDDETWSGQATTDLNVTFLNAATSDVTAEGRVLRSGRSVAFVQVDVRDTEGKAIAVGRATYMIIRR